MRRFMRNRAAVLCAAVVLFVALATFVGPWIAAGFGLDAVTQDAHLGATAPSLSHPLGTDVLGRDLLVRVLVGGRVALRVAVLGAALAVVLGVAWGAVAGIAGGRVDEVMMRIVDVLYSLPADGLRHGGDGDRRVAQRGAPPRAHRRRLVAHDGAHRTRSRS